MASSSSATTSRRPRAAHVAPPETLEQRLAAALTGDGRTLPRVCALAPSDRSERLRVLMAIYTAQAEPARAEAVLGGAPRLAVHPAVMGLKWRLETQWLEELSRLAGVVDSVPETNAAEGLRALVASQSVPAVYPWLAKEASAENLVSFVATEGGPDAGLPELVAVAQVGASLACAHGLSRAAWEMAGEGVLARSRAQSHHAARVALGIERPAVKSDAALTISPGEFSDAALQRVAVRGLLLTNPGLRPELLGYVAMALLQAPPKCELMLKAMRRLRVPSEALRMYEPLTEAHSRLGANFVTDVVKPAVRETPDWSHRVIRGARWRASLELELLNELHDGLRDGSIGAPRAA